MLFRTICNSQDHTMDPTNSEGILSVHPVEMYFMLCMLNLAVLDHSYELMPVCTDAQNDDDEELIPSFDVQHPEKIVRAILVGMTTKRMLLDNVII